MKRTRGAHIHEPLPHLRDAVLVGEARGQEARSGGVGVALVTQHGVARDPDPLAHPRELALLLAVDPSRQPPERRDEEPGPDAEGHRHHHTDHPREVEVEEHERGQGASSQPEEGEPEA